MINKIRNIMRGLTTEGWVEQNSQDREVYRGWSEGPVTLGQRNGDITAIAPSGLTVSLLGVALSSAESTFHVRKRAMDEGIEFAVDGQPVGIVRKPRHGLLRKHRIANITVYNDRIDGDLATRLAPVDGSVLRPRGLGASASLEDNQGLVVRFGLSEPKVRGLVSTEVVLLHLLAHFGLDPLMR